MLDYLSVIILGISAIIPIILDYIKVPDKYKHILIVICMITLIISIFFSLQGVSDSKEKDKDLEKLTKRNLQIRDSVVIITENTKRLRSNLIETLNLLEDFEGKSTSNNVKIKNRLSRSARDLKDIIQQSHSLASTSTRTQKILTEILHYVHIDSLYRARKAKQDSIEVAKANYFRTLIGLELAENSYNDSVRTSVLITKINTLESIIQEQENKDTANFNALYRRISTLENIYNQALQTLNDTFKINQHYLQSQINNLKDLLTQQPENMKAIKTAVINLNGNFARQQDILNKLNQQVTNSLNKLEQNQKSFIPPRSGGLVPDSL